MCSREKEKKKKPQKERKTPPSKQKKKPKKSLFATPNMVSVQTPFIAEHKVQLNVWAMRLKHHPEEYVHWLPQQKYLSYQTLYQQNETSLKAEI